MSGSNCSYPSRCGARREVELHRRIIAFIRRRPRAQFRRRTGRSVLGGHRGEHRHLGRGIYAALEDEARARSLRDPRDWPVVASALALTAGIWTNDNDFLGTGVATWTTDTLHRRLQRQLEP